MAGTPVPPYRSSWAAAQLVFWLSIVYYYWLAIVQDIARACGRMEKLICNHRSTARDNAGYYATDFCKLLAQG